MGFNRYRPFILKAQNMCDRLRTKHRVVPCKTAPFKALYTFWQSFAFGQGWLNNRYCFAPWKLILIPSISILKKPTRQPDVKGAMFRGALCGVPIFILKSKEETIDYCLNTQCFLFKSWMLLHIYINPFEEARTCTQASDPPLLLFCSLTLLLILCWLMVWNKTWTWTWTKDDANN